MKRKHSPVAAWRSRSFRLKLLDRLKFFLLIPPALGWAVIFMSLAGVRPLEKVLVNMPDAVQVLTLFGCPLLAVILGLRAVAEVGGEGARRGVAWCWLTTGAGMLLFMFGVLVALKA